MITYIARRLLATLPVIVMVAIVIFAILRLTPGDPAAIIAGDDATAAQLEQIRQTMGLDQPIYTQFFVWVGRLLQGDLGVSLLSGTPVLQMIAGRMGPTLALAVSTIVLTVIIAIPLGVIAAWRQGKLLDRLIMSLSVLG
ncbi:MAG: ABC transporter permease, partial [Advenella sp.]